MDERQQNLSFGEMRKIQMTMPERIVLSAGYDGDDNEDTHSYVGPSTFDETPILNADTVLAGMKTPPSVLTIDHRENSQKNNSPNWHTEGDGAYDDESQSSFQRFSRQLQQNDDREENENDDDFPVPVQNERSVIIAGQETDYSAVSYVSFDDQNAMKKWYTSMQRRIKMGKKNKKNSELIEQRRKKRNNIASSAVKNNPFEVRVNRLKHDVIGKKTKTDRGIPGVARSKANEKRKKTLLKEYKQRFKTNQIIDKRFGQFDENISPEEKMLKRFTLEKQKHHERSGLYNMEDDSDDEQLTHYGQSLADMENFDDAGLKLTDDEENENDINDHFGGFLTKRTATDKIEGEKSLSKQEIMDQIVANSKKNKFERQQTRELAFELTQKLDSQWKEIQTLLVKRDDKKNTPYTKPDDYDRTVNELIFEAKAQATDKLKTQEEMAREEKQRLEMLERERQFRMFAVDTDEDEKTPESADALIERKAKKTDDRYEVQYADGKMVMPEKVTDLLTESMEKENYDIRYGDYGDDNDNEDEDDVEDDETNDSDIFSEEDEDIDEKNDLEEVVIKNGVNKSNEKTKRERPVKTSKELPYVYTAPNDILDFLKITKDKNHQEILTILQRIKKLHHIKLDACNEVKLEKLFDIMLVYIDQLCVEEKPPLKFVSQLAGFTYELVNDVTHHATRSCQTKLKHIFQRVSMRAKVKGNTGLFPTLSELIFFRVIAIIFPTSDLNHVVTTPCLVLMAKVISKNHLTNMKDVISSIFLVNIIYDYIKLSRRYVPEVICFFSKLLYQAANPKKKLHKISTSVLNLRKQEENLLLVEKKWENVPAPINISKSLSLSCNVDSLQNDSVRISCINNVLTLLKKFLTLYKDMDCFYEIFQPCTLLIARLPVENYPSTIKSLYTDVLGTMELSEKKQKVPLTLQARKPIPLPLLEPQFDEHYEIRTKRRVGDKAQNESEKLKYKVKKERKAATREIRKDAYFLAKEQLKETVERDVTRKRKVKDLQRALENERREIKEMEKASSKF